MRHLLEGVPSLGCPPSPSGSFENFQDCLICLLIKTVARNTNFIYRKLEKQREWEREMNQKDLWDVKATIFWSLGCIFPDIFLNTVYIFKWEATLEALPEAPWISWTERWDWTKGLRRWSYFFVKIWSGKHGACSIHFSDQKAGKLLLLTGTETQFLL